MKITELFGPRGPRRPSRRKARAQVAALRAKTAAARQQVADTDAMLAAGKEDAK